MLKIIIYFITEIPAIRFILLKANWFVLKGFGGGKFIKSFSIWVIIVPIFAKIFNSIPEEIFFHILEKEFILILKLPFKLTVFYFCSVIFGLSNLIFTFSCPPLIKNYKYASEFVDKGGTISQLKGFIINFDSNKKSKYKIILEENGPFNDNIKLQVFNDLANDLKLENSLSRLVLVILYSIGLFLLVCMFIDNTLAVLGM